LTHHHETNIGTLDICPKLAPTLYVYIVVIANVVQKYCLLLFFPFVCVLVLGLIHGCAQTHFGPDPCYAHFGHVMETRILD